MEPSEPLLWEYGTKSPAELRRGLKLIEVSAAPKFDYPISQIS